MATVDRGSIVWAEVADPQGNNPKVRPMIVLTPSADIQLNSLIQCVALSTQIDLAPIGDLVELPWHAQGHPRTGLKERCAAVCTWLVEIPVNNVRYVAGKTPAKQLLEIQAKIDRLLQ